MKARGHGYSLSMAARLALLAALLVATGCRSTAGACDADALRKAVQAVELERGKHPAWFGDPTEGQISGLLAREKLLEACLDLPDDIKVELGRTNRIWSDRTTPKALSTAQAETFRRRRNEACKDPTVFAELPSVEPAKRGPTMLARCGLADEYEPNEPLGEALNRIGLLAPVLRHHLVEHGVDRDLATQAVELFGYPTPATQTKAKLARVETSAARPPEAGLLIRASSENLMLVDGPTVPFDGLTSEILGAWIEAQSPYDAAGWDTNLVLDFDADVPAEAVAAVSAAVHPEIQANVFLLIEDPESVGAEVIPSRSERPDSHNLTASGRKVSVRTTEGELQVEGDHKALTQWAFKLGHPRAHVRIDPTGLDIQTLVDIQTALHGPACRLDNALRGEQLPEECHVVSYRLAR